MIPDIIPAVKANTKATTLDVQMMTTRILLLVNKNTLPTARHPPSESVTFAAHLFTRNSWVIIAAIAVAIAVKDSVQLTSKIADLSTQNVDAAMEVYLQARLPRLP
jgi:hypothetical protein